MKNREERGLENNWNRNYLKSISNLLGKVQFLKSRIRIKKLIKKNKNQENDDKRTMLINISYSLYI